MLRSEWNLYVATKKALYKEFYSKEDPNEDWANALLLRKAIKDENDSLVDCLVEKYDCDIPAGESEVGEETPLDCDFDVSLEMYSDLEVDNTDQGTIWIN